MCIAVARLDGDGLLQGRNSVRYATNLEAGKAEIVLDGCIERFQQRCIVQRRDRIGRSPCLKTLGG
jgi:hypothetical protein